MKGTKAQSYYNLHWIAALTHSIVLSAFAPKYLWIYLKKQNQSRL